MSLDSEAVYAAILEMRDLLRLMAEPAIAERDRKHRTELRRLGGNSAPKAKAAALMNGTRTQSALVAEIKIHKGSLSDFVKQLNTSKLLRGDPKLPELAITLPPDFFSTESKDE